MKFDIVLLLFACLLVTGPLIASKLFIRIAEWVGRWKFNRLVDRVAESGR